VNYRRTSQNKRIIRIAVTTLVCIVLLALVPKVLHVVFSVVVAPVNIVKTWAAESGRSLPLYLRNRTELVDEIHGLRQELATVGGDIFTLNTLVKENRNLRSLMGDDGEVRVLAGVIGRPGTLPYDTLMIDRGTDNGVLTGAPVYIGQNTVIGIVKYATNNSAVVELATTAGFEATVYIMGPDIYTNAVGMGGGQLRVGVPQGIELSEGDLVVLPSVTSGVYGEISVVQSEASRPEQYGFVSPHTPLSSIRLVSVGTTPIQSVSFEEAQTILTEIKSDLFTVPVPDTILVDLVNGTTSSSTVIEEQDEE
jgi:cell shape-determining protein MreC